MREFLVDVMAYGQKVYLKATRGSIGGLSAWALFRAPLTPISDSPLSS